MLKHDGIVTDSEIFSIPYLCIEKKFFKAGFGWYFAPWIQIRSFSIFSRIQEAKMLQIKGIRMQTPMI